MKVTKIEEISKTRSKVYLDEEFAFVLYKGELRSYGIKVGSEVDQETFSQIHDIVLSKRAKLRAMNLLKTRMYTEKQLRDKLLQGGYTEDLAEEAIRYVASFHYIDDREYTREYLRCQINQRSRKDIEQKLYQRGISGELLAEVYEEMIRDGDGPDEEMMIQKLIEKKHFSVNDAEEKEKQRIYAFFYRKGYSLEAVKRVFKNLST